MGILFLVSGVVPALRAESTPAPAPVPPPWQRDLDSARGLEASLLLIPAKDASEKGARDQHVAQLYLNLARKYPDQAPVQKASGDYAWRQNRTNDAIPILLRAQVLDPSDGDTADVLGSAYLKLGRIREASAQFERAVIDRPNDADYHFDLANVLYLFRRELTDPPALPDENAVLTRSLAEFRLAATLAPHDMRFAEAYAETFYNLPRPDWAQALVAWEAVLVLSGPNADFANSHLARINLRLKRPAEAERYLSRIQDPKFDSLKANLRAQAAKLPPAP